MSVKVLITSDPKYKGYPAWSFFKDTLVNLMSKIQYDHSVSINEIEIMSNIPMAVAWARKNNLKSYEFKEDWDNIDRIIAFDSGNPKMKERIDKAKSFGLIVDIVKITLDKQ